MQQDTEKSIEHVSEQDLQAVTGGCSGCFAMGSVAHNAAGKASDNAIKYAQDAPSTASKETQRAIELTKIAFAGQNNAKNPVEEGLKHCNNYPNLIKQIQPHLRFTNN